MSPSVMRRAWLVGFIGAGLALAGLAQVRADEGAGTGVLAMSTGYGVDDDCLDAGGACGRLVADAWCRARGLGHAASFGPQETGEAASPDRRIVACVR
jgi:hypothetical protein